VAICQDCEQEMLEATSCTVDALMLDGRRFARDRARGPSAASATAPTAGSVTGATTTSDATSRTVHDAGGS
jgi:hypothetical protein